VEEETRQSDAARNESEGEVVLCPVRGGKQSHKTVDRAVELALASSARLVFLYVVDVDFLGFATVARVKVMVDELTETGRFTLSILEDRARARGLADVRSVIREGTIGDVIHAVAEEIGATLLVLGRPIRTPGVMSFSASEFDGLIGWLQTDAGLRVECVD
jgi:nucleotide-binding universal stress UspA family protein